MSGERGQASVSEGVGMCGERGQASLSEDVCGYVWGERAGKRE